MFHPGICCLTVAGAEGHGRSRDLSCSHPFAIRQQVYRPFHLLSRPKSRAWPTRAEGSAFRPFWDLPKCIEYADGRRYKTIRQTARPGLSYAHEFGVASRTVNFRYILGASIVWADFISREVPHFLCMTMTTEHSTCANLSYEKGEAYTRNQRQMPEKIARATAIWKN
jgi:hypothetical protein